MTFDERYHRNAETVEDENPPLPSMTREEALKALREILETEQRLPEERQSYCSALPSELRQIIAALSSCACGGREPIWVGEAIAYQCAGGSKQLIVRFYPPTIGLRDLPVRVLVFADEPREEQP